MITWQKIAGCPGENGARQNEAVMAPVDQIGVLIEQRTGEEPMMK